MQSIYIAIAKLRWLDYDITGAGPVAVVFNSDRKVVLVATAQEAAQLGGTVQRLDKPRPGAMYGPWG